MKYTGYLNGLYPHWFHMELAGEGTCHRAIGDIPDCKPAVDVFKEDANGKITIVNRSDTTYKNPYVS